MGNYSSLKATINANVKANNNQEITGNILNSVLNTMVDSVGAGYQYLGIATPTSPGTDQTPDYRCFYIATTPGTYSHLGGLVVNDGEVAILKYDSTWHKDVTGAATAAQVTELGQELKYELTKANIITTGFLQSDGTLYSNANWGTTDYLPVVGIKQIAVNLRQASAQVYVCFFDSSKTLISSDNSYTNIVPCFLSIPDNAVYMRCSFALTGADGQYIRGLERTFREQTNFNHSFLSKYIRGKKIYVSELWDDGLIRGFISNSSGAITSNVNFRVSDYLPISGDAIVINLYSYQTSVYLAFYDSAKNLLLSRNYTSLSEMKIVPPSGSEYLRISMNKDHKTDSYFYKASNEMTIAKGTVSTSILTQSTTNTNYVWFQVLPYLSHIDKIRFLAKTGTTNFYKVNTTTTPATLTLVQSVVNTSAENNTVKEIGVNVDLAEGEFLGFNGTIAYSATGNPGYLGGSCKSDGTNVSMPSNGFACGFEVVCNLMSIVDELLPTDSQIVKLDASGNGDYTNIYDALKYTMGKDTATHPLTILVMPGTYETPTLAKEEFFSYCKNRYLSIIGTDKVNCILRNDEGYYNASGSDPNNLGDNSVIKISGNVYLANLTLISTDDNNAEQTAPEYHRSYCIHNDAQAPSGTTTEIHNCVLINNHAPCIGFGIYPNTTLKITDCELRSDFYDPTWTWGGAVIYGHDQGGSTSVIEEHLIVKNCIIASSNGHAVKTVNTTNSLMGCTFVGNACDLPSGKGIELDSTTSVVAPSFGNNIEAMNA